MRYKWFWSTLALWTFLGTALAWALITSSRSLDEVELGSYSASINGRPQTYSFFASSQELEGLHDAVSRDWNKEGWELCSKDLNLAPLLFGIPGSDTPLSAYLQASLFRNKDSYQLLGLWRDEARHRTLRFVARIPAAALTPAVPGDDWDFPIRPPRDAQQTLCFHFQDLRWACWSHAPGASDRSFFESQGLSVTNWAKNNDEDVYWMHKGRHQFLAQVGRQDALRTISVMQLD